MKENTNLWFIYDNGKTGKTLFPVQQIFHSLLIFFPDFPAMACIDSNLYMLCTMGLQRRIEKSLWLNYWDWKMISIFFLLHSSFPLRRRKVNLFSFAATPFSICSIYPTANYHFRLYVISRYVGSYQIYSFTIAKVWDSIVLSRTTLNNPNFLYIRIWWRRQIHFEQRNLYLRKRQEGILTFSHHQIFQIFSTPLLSLS